VIHAEQNDVRGIMLKWPEAFKISRITFLETLEILDVFKKLN
jgi:hypothetical protein